MSETTARRRPHTFSVRTEFHSWEGWRSHIRGDVYPCNICGPWDDGPKPYRQQRVQLRKPERRLHNRRWITLRDLLCPGGAPERPSAGVHLYDTAAFITRYRERLLPLAEQIDGIAALDRASQPVLAS